MRFRVFPFYIAVSVSWARGDNCCPHCSESCPWNYACDNGNDIDCMENVAGPFACQDHSKCTDYDECTEDDAAQRAGHVCNNVFPFYNGGYPMGSLK